MTQGLSIGCSLGQSLINSSLVEEKNCLARWRRSTCSEKLIPDKTIDYSEWLESKNSRAGCLEFSSFYAILDIQEILQKNPVQIFFCRGK
jgi:hypothetical protein